MAPVAPQPWQHRKIATWQRNLVAYDCFRAECGRFDASQARLSMLHKRMPMTQCATVLAVAVCDSQSTFRVACARITCLLHVRLPCSCAHRCNHATRCLAQSVRQVLIRLHSSRHGARLPLSARHIHALQHQARGLQCLLTRQYNVLFVTG